MAAILREQREEILARWEAAASQLPRARHLGRLELRDSVPELLDRVALLVEAGDDPAAIAGTAQPKEHALHRLAQGFDAAQVVAELALLRRVMLEVGSETRALDTRVVLGVGRVVDEATCASVESYSHARDDAFHAVDLLSRATLESRSLDELLERLLRALVELEGVDTAAIMLREDDHLRLRALAGLSFGDPDLRIRIGEGFAGRIAAERRSLTIHAGSSLLEESPNLRERGIRVLHGVPLLDRGELVGVALMGSLSEDELSDWQRRILDSMATRAASGLALHLARDAADEAGALLEGILEHAPVGVGFWDRELRYRRVNARLAAINGLPPEAHVGRTTSELLPALEDVAGIEARWRDVLASGHAAPPREIAGETPAAPGERRFFVEQAYPVRVRGEMMGLGAVVQERTDERRTQEALALLARTGDALAAVGDPDAVLARIAEMTVPGFADWAIAALLEHGKARRVIARAVPSHADRASALNARWAIRPDAAHGIGRVLREGEPELISKVDEAFVEAAAEGEAERAFVRDLGLRSYVAAPLRVHGEVIGALAFAVVTPGRHFDGRDLSLASEIARRAAVAVENARLYQEARHEAELRQQVLAVVSHDLRNPLSAILMSVPRLRSGAREDAAGDRLRRTADTIRRSAERMNRLIGDLLDAAAIQAGRLSVQPTPQPPAALVREAAEALRAAAREKGLEVEVRAREDLPAVLADRDRVLQVLSNLGTNAVKATEAGGVTFEVEARESRAAFTVRDTGPGLPPEVRGRLFDPYVRGADAQYRGTGLGLSIAHGIVEAHGGEIGVEAEPGQGSAFWFTLPLA